MSDRTYALFRALDASTRFETRLNKRRARARPGRRLSLNLTFVEVGLGTFAVLVAAAAYVGKPTGFNLDAMRWTSLVALTLAYLVLLIHPFVAAWIHRRSLAIAAKNPLGLLLSNAKATTRVDLRYLPHLKRESVEDLEMVLMEVKTERDFFERRSAAIFGPVEKIGLFPGLLALGVLLHNLQAIQPSNPPAGQSSWITVLAYSSWLWGAFSTYTVFALGRLDRHIKLLELALNRKRNAPISSAESQR